MTATSMLPALPPSAAPTVLFPPFACQPVGRLVYGVGEIARLGALVRELGGTRVLLVTDPGLEAAGHPQRAMRSMREAGLEVSVFDGVEENPDGRHVEAGVET